MTNSLTSRHLDQLAYRIARDGIAANEAAVGRVVRHAAAFGVAPTPVGVLGDRTAPPVARERAFARVVAALERERMRTFTAAS